MRYQGAGGTSKEQRERNKILNDSMPEPEFEEFITNAMSRMEMVMKAGASCYIFYKELGYGTFIKALARAGLTFKQELIWVKNALVLGGSNYQNMYEPFLYGSKGNNPAIWTGKRVERSVIEHVDLMNETELRDAIREITEVEPADVVREHKMLFNDLHPTMKPVKLMAKLITNSTTDENNTVLDLFGGSGSTLMACEQLGRKAYVMELDPKYVDVIIERWEEFTGQKAVLLS